MAKWEDTRPGTDAEVLLAVMNVATKAPLKPAYAVLAETVYERVFNDPATLSWPGDVEALLAEVRSITAVPTRKL